MSWSRAQRTDVMKISNPMLDLAVAKRWQMLTLNVLSFPASDYLAKIAARPTPEQIRNQYDSFSDRIAEQYGMAGDSLGSGYKYPNRVKIDYIGVKQADVQRAGDSLEKQRGLVQCGIRRIPEITGSISTAGMLPFQRHSRPPARHAGFSSSHAAVAVTNDDDGGAKTG